MPIVNRLILKTSLLSLLLIWAMAYRLNVINLPNVIIILVILIADPTMWFKTSVREVLKVRFSDKQMFLNDLIRAMEKVSFVPSTSFEGRVFFKRVHLFHLFEEFIEVQFDVDSDCLIKLPYTYKKEFQKSLAAYLKIREVEFLKETDKLMEQK